MDQLTILPNTKSLIEVVPFPDSEVGRNCKKYSGILNKTSDEFSNSALINSFNYRFILPIQSCITTDYSNLDPKVQTELAVRSQSRFSHYQVIESEYCAGGDLASFVAKNGRPNKDVLRQIFVQLVLGLQYLHSHKYVHGNLTSKTVFVRLRKGSDSKTECKWGNTYFDVVIGGFNSVIPMKPGVNIAEIKEHFSFDPSLTLLFNILL